MFGRALTHFLLAKTRVADRKKACVTDKKKLVLLIKNTVSWVCSTTAVSLPPSLHSFIPPISMSDVTE